MYLIISLQKWTFGSLADLKCIQLMFMFHFILWVLLFLHFSQKYFHAYWAFNIYCIHVRWYIFVSLLFFSLHNLGNTHKLVLVNFTKLCFPFSQECLSSRYSFNVFKFLIHTQKLEFLKSKDILTCFKQSLKFIKL